MVNNNSSSPSTSIQFDVAAAALEHLELLNCSTLNPLEIAAQFRTLLRSKKTCRENQQDSPSSSTIDYTYLDYIAADATYRRRRQSRNHLNCRSKSLGRIQYNLDEDQCSLHDESPLRSCLPESQSSFGISKVLDEEKNCTEDLYPDSAMGSDSSASTSTTKVPSYDSASNNVVEVIEPSKPSVNRTPLPYPTINWKQLREKQNELRCNQSKKFLTNKLSPPPTLYQQFHAHGRPAKGDPSTVSQLRQTFEQKKNALYLSSCRSRSSSNSTRAAYSVSQLAPTAVNTQHDDVLVPIVDCNLIVTHKVIGRTKLYVPQEKCLGSASMSRKHFQHRRNENDATVAGRRSEEVVYL